MGDTIWIDVQGRDPAQQPRDNSILLRLEPQLEALADKLNVTRLTQYYGRSGWLRRERWFEPEPALTAVKAIHGHLCKSPDDLGMEIVPSRQHWPDQLMKDLLECHRELEKALTAGKKFRFLIVS